jgi:hypothetical protein
LLCAAFPGLTAWAKFVTHLRRFGEQARLRRRALRSSEARKRELGRGARPSAAKAVLVWRRLRHDLSRALTTNQDAKGARDGPRPLHDSRGRLGAPFFVLVEAFADAEGGDFADQRAG